jgi:putative peptidoglycan lipid II flippase
MIERFNTGDPALALFALRLMFPIVLFHAVTYILQGVLQSNKRFYLPAAVSAFSGLSVIVYVVFFAGRFGIKGLLAATFIGLASQALVLIPPVAGPLKYRYRPSLRLSDEDMRLAGKLALPVLVSSSSYQFNMFMNSTFAAGFEGGVITITNMQTLALTAAQLFILSTLSVFFPGMSASFATGDFAGLKNAFNKVIRLIIVFAVPASAALAYLSRFIIPLLYGYGKVTESDINISVTVFAIYALAIASIGFKEAADRAFYAVRDSRTPAAVSIIIMALNIALSILFMKFFGIAGLPAAYIVAITSGAAILLLLLRGKMRR